MRDNAACLEPVPSSWESPSRKTREEIEMSGSSKNGRKQVGFEVKAEPDSQVFVCGSFNEWNATQFRMKNNGNGGPFKTKLLLPAGRHEYKSLVNCEWITDPNCPEQAPNDCGSINSVIVV
jgi:1,4-alpha-glucan branching enzyme